MRALALAVVLVACGGGRGQPDHRTSSTSTTTSSSASSTSSTAAAPRAPARVAILVSVDGLLPRVYTERTLAVPTLRSIVARGAWARSVTSVMPSVTYPAHTTLATGVHPSVHGIVSNRAFDPLETNRGGWRWYAEDIRARTLWDAAAAAGQRAALLQWPVTVGARARFLVPEYWRADPAEDLKLLRALSTPGLLEGAARRFPKLLSAGRTEGVSDSAVIDVAIHILETEPPELLLLHLADVDGAEHTHGADSPQATAAVEEVDRQLARLLDTVRARGLADRTALFVVSDHGMLPTTTELRPMALFREHGLVTVAPGTTTPTAWRAAIQANGGTAYVYLADPADRATADEVRALLAPHAAPGGLIRRFLEPADIQRLGGDPAAFLALEGADGVVFQEGAAGPWKKTSGSRGHHGWAPDHPAMNASFLAVGAGVRAVALGDIAMVDVAPTVAAYLGLELPGAHGRALDLFTKDATP